jgi:hypothetical protein
MPLICPTFFRPVTAYHTMSQLYLVLDLMETDLHRLLKSLKSRGDHLTPTHTYADKG